MLLSLDVSWQNLSSKVRALIGQPILPHWGRVWECLPALRHTDGPLSTLYCIVELAPISTGHLGLTKEA